MALIADSSFPPARPEAPEIAGHRIDWTGRDIVIGLLLFVAVFVLLPLLVLPLALIYEQGSSQFLTAAMVVSAFIYVGIAFVAARMTFLKYGGGWERLGVGPPTGRTLGWAAAAFAGALFVSVSYGALVNALRLEGLKQSCADQIPREIRDDHAMLALSAFVAVVFAPVCEELFFRGFTFTGLARAWGLGAGIVASGLLFGAAHLLGNPLLYKSFVEFAAIGMVFGYAYYKSGNLVSTMMAHFTFNLMGMVLIASTTCPK